MCVCVSVSVCKYAMYVSARKRAYTIRNIAQHSHIDISKDARVFCALAYAHVSPRYPQVCVV